MLKKHFIWRLVEKTKRHFWFLFVIMLLSPNSVFAASIATTTCSYTNPVLGYYDTAQHPRVYYNPPGSLLDPDTVVSMPSLQFGSSTCVTVDNYPDPAGGGSASATTTISNPNQDLFNGFVIFGFMLVFIIWFFRKH